MKGGFFKKEEFSFRQILFKHLDRILEIATQEFRSGYIQKKIKEGFIEEVYIPDNRKRYIQSIECLFDILLPHLTDTSKEKCGKITEKLKSLSEEYQKKKIEIGSPEHNEYVFQKLEIIRLLFQELNLLLDEKNYFAEQIYEEMAQMEEAEDDDMEE